MKSLEFELLQQSPQCHARLGRVTTPHGSFDTPAFMPVGTQATVKGLLPSLVAATQSQIVLSNTYHLMLRPGSALVAEMGGLHRWMNWPKPILTDSGGFQVFSLADISRITEQGVEFKSHLDGSKVSLTPERSMQVQNELGADIIMAFDDCPPGYKDDEADEETQPEAGRSAAAGKVIAGSPQRTREAAERTLRWLDRCKAAHSRAADQSLFGIIQGGTDLALRSWCAEHVCSHDLPGYAIGGVAVGEGFAGLKLVVEHTAPLMPRDKPRYLMGVGYERDILTAVRAGVDMFDCVLPTRNGRNASAFAPSGQMKLRNAKYASDDQPIDPTCDCVACAGDGMTSRGYSRSYLRHLFQTGEMLGPMLVSLHNIRHFQRFLLDIRRAIAENDWSLIRRRWPVVEG